MDDLNDYETFKKEYEDFIHRMSISSADNSKQQMISDLIDKMLNEISGTASKESPKDIFTTEEFDKTCSELGLVDD